MNSDSAKWSKERLRRAATKTPSLSCWLLCLSSVSLAQTVTIQIRVIDGRNGHPLSGMSLAFVDYRSDPKGGNDDDLNQRTTVPALPEGDSYTARANGQGVLVFNGMDANGSWTPCSKQDFYDNKTRAYGKNYLYTVSTIVTSGLAAQNSCSKVREAAKPGELVIFVRPTTWWERFVAGMKS